MNCRGLLGRQPGFWTLALAALAVGTAWLAPGRFAHAQDAAAPEASAARLSSVEGQVRIAQGSQLLADPALANTPLFEGTELLSSDDGRAELQFEDGSVVRLSPNSSLTLAALRGQGGTGDEEIVLNGGLAYFELHGEAGQIQVRFGDSVVTPSGFTVMRVNLDNPPGELAVFSGNAHLERGSALSVDLHGGESVALNAGDPAQYVLNESIEPDSWDAWNSDLDQAQTSAQAASTGAANSLPDKNNPAWSDLDANGNWYNVPDEGPVWSPYEAASADWDPYGNGNWMWTPRFGYIWVSGDSWGYLPYQCGAWNFYGGFGWGWAPGMCSPWWGTGLWVSNIRHWPGGYRPPMRPHPMPVRGMGGRPAIAGFTAAPYAVVAVDRRPPAGTEGVVMRDRNAPVTIAGHVVQPLRAVSPRPQYDHSASAQAYRSQPASMGARTPTGQRPASGAVYGSRPGYSAPARPGGAQRAPVYSRPAPNRSAPPSRAAPAGGAARSGGSGHR
jgi:hypothetical protein